VRLVHLAAPVHSSLFHSFFARLVTSSLSIFHISRVHLMPAINDICGHYLYDCLHCLFSLHVAPRAPPPPPERILARSCTS